MATILVAYDEDRGIGKDGDIPWRLPEDMANFKKLTTGQVCIMGRNTWESLPPKFRPLPDRVNFIISSQYIADQDKFHSTFEEKENAPVYVTPELHTGIDLAKLYYPDREIFIVGGQRIYEDALLSKALTKIIVSEVQGKYDCDVFFPRISEMNWSRQEKESFDKFNILEFTRVHS